MRHFTLIAVALALAGSVDAAEATIPDVATLNDLRAAPLLRLTDGTECHVGSAGP